MKGLAMQRLLIAMILWAGLAQASCALTVEERLVQGLQDQGYTVLEQGYTFLGRLRVVAENDQIHREIVVNPGTGEILRDYAVYLTDMPQDVPQAQVATRDNKVRNSSRPSVTGTAGVAVLALDPGTSTLGSANLQLDTTRNSTATPLDNTILPMTTGIP